MGRWLLMILAIATLAVKSEAATTPPAGLVYTDNSRLVVATSTGRVLRRFGVVDHYSLDAGVLAASRRLQHPGRDELVIYDAASGKLRGRVANAFGPVVTDAGRSVLFLPDRDGHRDPTGDSVWVWRAGRVRMVVRFSNDPHYPGVHTPGFPDVPALLTVSTDTHGARLAVAVGNDVDLFFYDIWLVDVPNGHTRRLTTGLRSREPSLRADGAMVAYIREHGGMCAGGPLRASDVRIIPAGGGQARTVARGTCGRIYAEPVWASNDQLVALRISASRSDLVLINTRTGRMAPLTTSGDIADFSVSAGRGLLAYERASGSGFTVVTLATAATRQVGRGATPRVSGDHVF